MVRFGVNNSAALWNLVIFPTLPWGAQLASCTLYRLAFKLGFISDNSFFFLSFFDDVGAFGRQQIPLIPSHNFTRRYIELLAYWSCMRCLGSCPCVSRLARTNFMAAIYLDVMGARTEMSWYLVCDPTMSRTICLSLCGLLCLVPVAL